MKCLLVFMVSHAIFCWATLCNSISQAMSKQKYRDEWETISENNKLLSRIKMDAHCKACECEIMSALAPIKQRAASQKHKEKTKLN